MQSDTPPNTQSLPKKGRGKKSYPFTVPSPWHLLDNYDWLYLFRRDHPWCQDRWLCWALLWWGCNCSPSVPALVAVWYPCPARVYWSDDWDSVAPPWSTLEAYTQSHVLYGHWHQWIPHLVCYPHPYRHVVATAAVVDQRCLCICCMYCNPIRWACSHRRLQLHPGDVSTLCYTDCAHDASDAILLIPPCFVAEEALLLRPATAPPLSWHDDDALDARDDGYASGCCCCCGGGCCCCDGCDDRLDYLLLPPCPRAATLYNIAKASFHTASSSCTLELCLRRNWTEKR